MREDLLNGKLEYPGLMSIVRWIEKENDIYAFWNAIWYSFLNNEDTNGLYWYDRLGPKCFNDIIRSLDQHKWIISQSLTGRKWASVELNGDKLLEWLSPEEIQEVRAAYKYQKYTLTHQKSTITDMVKQNNIMRATGLVRKGFCAAGNTSFRFDMKTLQRHKGVVQQNLTKSMDKIRDMYPEMRSDSATYDNVSSGIFDWHMGNPQEAFTTGNNISDSRGRAISDCLSKVTNPITNKDFRSALVITYKEDI